MATRGPLEDVTWLAQHIVLRYNIEEMTTDAKPQIDYRALAALRYEIRRFLNFSEQAARDAGIEPQQHQALLAIKGLPAGQTATVGVLAERLQIQHHSAVELVNRLAAKGLLRRLRGQNDRREVLLRLTSRGERLLKNLTLPHRAELRSTGPTLLRALKEAIEPRGRVRGRTRGRATA
jgi:DNA-binding MarR family transcriptional regulator